MAEKLFILFTEDGHLIIAALLVFVAYSFLQAAVKWLSDIFLVKVFKRKLPNGNGKNNVRLEALSQQMVDVMKDNGTKLDCLPKMAEQTNDMHGLVMEKDNDGFPRLKVMEKKVREIFKILIKER